MWIPGREVRRWRALTQDSACRETKKVSEPPHGQLKSPEVPAMPRYVILEHDHPELHWDFMLESGDVLRSWRLAEPPQAGRAVRATASFDHRRMYLDYEGPVSGGRGRVTRWDAGTFRGEADRDEPVAVHLDGARLRGSVIVRRVTAEEWEMAYAPSSEAG